MISLLHELELISVYMNIVIYSTQLNSCRTNPCKSSNTVLRQLGSLSSLQITTHVTSNPSSVYLWSTCLFCQSVKKSSPQRTTTTTLLLLACSFMQVPAYRNLHAW